ncbi:MAG: fused MFS/spermidine synthase [Candidatus Aenigmarchaeota archaeon]|nr:fused MFS/spermidine synthase [Candidatus Aenigmarchaeota archaeon]
MPSLLETPYQKHLFVSLAALGISSIAVQLVILREFLNVFSGNELVFGIVLGAWLLLTGLGSYIGKFSRGLLCKDTLFLVSQVIVAVAPFFIVYFIRSLKVLVLTPGEIAGLPLIASSLIVLLPYCLFSGMMLTVACSIFSKKESGEQIGKVYFIDNIGDILGGILFSFVFVFLLTSFEALFLLLLINLAAAFFFTSFLRRKLVSLLILLLLVFSTVAFFTLDPETQSLGLMFPGQEIVFHGDSPYGRLVVTETSGQLNFFENSVPLFSTQDIVAREETVHYAMVQHPNPKNVLLLSGGISGTIQEALKYEPERIDYVELDPLLLSLGSLTGGLEDPRVETFPVDGRLFVKTASRKYDVVIIDLPDPSTAQLNRFYTKEFFSEVKEILTNDGVVSLSVSSSPNYMSPETIRLNAIIFNTLETQFSNTIIIPGEQNFFLSSDSQLSFNISERIKEKGIQTSFVNENYLPGKLTPQRINYTRTAILGAEEMVNEDFIPLAYYHHLMFWLSQFEPSPLLFAVLAAVFIIAVALLVRGSAISFAISSTAFAASALSVVLIISFQILFGYVYQDIGILITSFIIGLAIGAFLMNKKIKQASRGTMLRIESLVFLYPVGLALLLQLQGIPPLAFPVLTMAIGALVGAEFPLASKLHFPRSKKVEHTAGSLYAADLLGASVGALLVSALMIPLIGIINVCLLIFLINLVSFLIVWRGVR